MEVKRIFDLQERYKEKFSNKTDAFSGKDFGEWKKYSTSDYIKISENISYGLLQLGVEKGDKIASITFNRPEWNFLDIGILQIGAIHIPIYPTISDSDYQYILQHADVKYIFVAGEEMFKRIKHIIPNIPTLKAVYTFRNLFGIQHLNELIDLGKNNPQPELLKSIKNSISEEDICTIIYTSGTTGNPKGVLLTHKNIVSNFIACSPIPPMGMNDRALSFLPLCHIYERMINYMYQYKGISIYYVDNLANIGEYALEAKPHILSTVPRVLEKIYDKALVKGEKLNGTKKQIFKWAINISSNYKDENNSLLYKIKLFFARKLVLNKVKANLGGELKIIISGGAALQPRLSKFFWAVGIKIMEGYGLTETSPVIAVNNFEKNGIKFGTVGPIINGVTVKIAEDGEILCKGPNVMSGYYKEPELTKESIDDEGWFHTGDVGMIDELGRLKITDRKKLIFKTSFGKYISPQVIENIMKESVYIDQLMVIGENQKFAGAIISPDFTVLKEWCKKNKLSFSSNDDIIQLSEIKKLIQNEINHFNTFLGETEQIKRFELVNSEWTVESGELSATLKLRRTTLNEKYAEIALKMFPNNN
ncbi:MAG: long-chain fatty acid--CoA ligase [Bacteroidota bacterium]